MPITHIIGQLESIQFPEIKPGAVMARVDTGARTSAIDVSNVDLVDDALEVTFFTPDNPLYTGHPIRFTDYSEIIVMSSNGMAERRYKVKLLVVIDGRRIRAKFTLANRSQQRYPVLLGRNVLAKKFLVDVSRDSEDARIHQGRPTSS